MKTTAFVMACIAYFQFTFLCRQFPRLSQRWDMAIGPKVLLTSDDSPPWIHFTTGMMTTEYIISHSKYIPYTALCSTTLQVNIPAFQANTLFALIYTHNIGTFLCISALWFLIKASKGTPSEQLWRSTLHAATNQRRKRLELSRFNDELTESFVT